MKKLIVFFILILICVGLSSPKAIASEEIQSSVNNVTVLPAKFDLSATHGQTIKQSLRIVNDSDDEYIYALSLDNISVMGENGEVGLGDGTYKLSNLFASWIETDEPSGKLQPKNTKTINFNIKIPEITEPGGKYASMIISLDKVLRNPGESSGIAKVVSLIMLTVAGDYKDNAQLVSFKTAEKSNGKYVFESRVRNQGIAHIKPVGRILITNIFGQKIDEISLNGENVLPGSTRRTLTEWDPPKRLFGIYHATLVAHYGQSGNQAITGVIRIMSFPFWQTLFALLALAVIVYWLISILKSRFSTLR